MRVYVCFHNISWLRKVAFHRTIMGTQGVHEIMQRIKLTPGRIASAVCPDGKQQAFLSDSEQPGLGLRTPAAGTTDFLFQAKLTGEAIRLTIGEPETWTVDAARKAHRHLTMIVNAGRRRN